MDYYVSASTENNLYYKNEMVRKLFLEVSAIADIL